MQRSLQLAATLLALTTFVPPGLTAAPEIAKGTLEPRNTEAPFCYRSGAARSWRILTGRVPDDRHITLAARRDQSVLAEGGRLAVGGLTVHVSDDGRLHIASKSSEDAAAFDLDVRLSRSDGTVEEQTLVVRAAPSDRPLSYIADFGDDIIRIFRLPDDQYRPIEKSGFDQYFRRLQAQGITRLILWLTPFPYITNREEFDPHDWQRHAAQSRAVLDSPELTAGIQAAGRYSPWGWLRQLMALRLRPNFGEMLTDSATEHGIRLTISFRPFEPALTKYYVVPAFDESGDYLWDFQPLSSPAVNYHREDVCFAHYREILRRMGNADAASLAAIELPGVANAPELVARFQAGRRDLELRASRFPPLAEDSLVLVRNSNGDFRLSPYREISASTLEKQALLSDYQLTVGDSGLRIENVSLPRDHHYIWLQRAADTDVEISVSTERPALSWATAGNPLGGENVWLALDETDSAPPPTRVSGIRPDGGFHAEFQATEASIAHFLNGPLRTPLAGKTLVVNLGGDWSIEMLDFTQAATRQFAVKQLRTIMAYPAFDEILINTRSHTQLAGYVGDHENAVRPIATLRRQGVRDYRQLGLDEAYAPRDATDDPDLRDLAAAPESVTRITQLQPGEWREHNCHQPGQFPWRYARNRLVADGVRMLLQDLEREFPETRVRAVLPPRAAAVKQVISVLDDLPKPGGGTYGRDYYRHIWASLNHIPNIGDGMALVDLTGTRVEPVLHGIRFAPDAGPLDLFVDACVSDLADMRGSRYSGPVSFFYEAQETLRSTDPRIKTRREEIICDLLTRQEINEVILYEAADWTYHLPWSNPDLFGYGFLDRCGDQSND